MSRPTVTLTPKDILDFWFGEDAASNWELLSDDKYVRDRCEFVWPSWDGPEVHPGDAAFEKECERFVPALRAAAAMTRGWLAEDDHSVIARVVLLDQIFRVIHRGCEKAFPFSTEEQVEIFGDMARAEARRFMDDADPSVCVPLAHLLVVSTTMMHSEDLDDHLAAMDFLLQHARAYSDTETFQTLKRSMNEHKAVIQRFGRFPHLNAAAGRKTTEAEATWLGDAANRPVWAVPRVLQKMKSLGKTNKPAPKLTSNSQHFIKETVVSQAKRIDSDSGKKKKPSAVAKKTSGKRATTGGVGKQRSIITRTASLEKAVAAAKIGR